jgi:hypothetical protein
MGFRQADSEGRGGFARIWSVEDKENYSIAKVSTSKKRKDDSGYDTDFQDGYVRLIGSAHEKAKTLNVSEKGIAIQITSCEVTTPYNAETKKGYVNFAIFAFNIPDENDGNATSVKNNKKSTAKTSKAKTKKETPDYEEMPEEELPF